MGKAESTVIIEKGVAATMRDGTVLKSDIYRPGTAGKHPVLMQRILYNKEHIPLATLTLDPIKAAHAGYVVVIQDVRGRFQSEGDRLYIYRDEFDDGYDSVQWAASLPYSNGSVGMFGASYMGMTQWQAAVMRPPALKALFPVTWGTGSYFYRDGAFKMGEAFTWCLKSIGPEAVLRDSPGDFAGLVNTIDNMESAAFEPTPLKEASWHKLGGGFVPFLKDILEHDTYDHYHQALDVKNKCSRVQVPSFCVAGWYDSLLGTNLDHFSRLKKEAATDTARRHTRLLVGPWAHSSFLNSVGELNFGLASSGFLLDLKTDLTDLQLRWFDYWLKGVDTGITEEAPVRIFVMGENRWRDEQEWPLARTQYTAYYFHSSGRANSCYGDGCLSGKYPGNEAADYFINDPRHPMPTRGGNIMLPMYYPRGPVDQSPVEKRHDVLVYTLDPLPQNLEITGPVKVILYAASSAPDTDFTAKLVDLHPGGQAYNIADGIIRARYREGVSASPSLIKPGAVYQYEIDLWSTSNVFKAGHRLRVEISSSNYPRYDRNPNTGQLARDSSEKVPALQTILHNAAYPSHILLPVIP